MNNNYNRIGWGAITDTMSKVIGICAGIITTPLLLKTLGIYEYGFYIAVSSFVGLVGLGNLGFNSVFSTKTNFLIVENNKEEVNKMISGFLLLNIFISLFILLASVLLIFKHWLPIDYIFNLKDNAIRAPYFIFFIILISTLWNVFFSGILSSFYYGINEIAKYNIINFIYSIAYSVVFIIYLIFSPSLEAIVVFQFVSYIIRSIFFIVGIYFHARWVRLRMKIQNIKYILSLFGFSLQYFLSNIGQSLWSRVDTLITSHFLGNNNVSFYNTTDKLFQFPSYLVDVASPSQPTMAMLYKKGDQIALDKLFKNVLRLHMITKIIIVTLVAVFFKEVITVWLGKIFFVSNNFVISFLLIYIAYAWASPFIIFLNSAFLQKLLILPSFISLLFNAVISIILVKSMGLLGVSLGTVLAFSIVFAVYVPLICKRYLRVNPFFELLKLVLGFAVPTIILIISSLIIFKLFSGRLVWELFFSVPTIFVYVLLVFILVLRDNERTFFKEYLLNISGKIKNFFVIVSLKWR